MANELSITTRLKANKGNLQISREASISADMSGGNMSLVAQDIGTTYEAVTIASDVGTEGYAYFRNLDTTNYVEVGVEVAAAFYPLIKLKAGEAAIVRLATGSVFAKANTASVILEAFVLED